MDEARQVIHMHTGLGPAAVAGCRHGGWSLCSVGESVWFRDTEVTLVLVTYTGWWHDTGPPFISKFDPWVTGSMPSAPSTQFQPWVTCLVPLCELPLKLLSNLSFLTRCFFILNENAPVLSAL